MRFLEDPDEIVLAQRIKLHPDREAPLQLRDEVRRLGGAERPGGNEEDVVRPHHAVAGIDG
ncbi:MAG: hypothetical protein CSYNP_04505 [Syntrophus sp. SKADARSKE-3]|nr:hypothetical protein [Syntrophus sp. SKADARSKE-3]